MPGLTTNAMDISDDKESSSTVTDSSVVTSSEIVDASSELSSPQGTMVAQKGTPPQVSPAGDADNRRSSGRVKAKPAFFDSSPQISIEKFIEITSPHKQWKSYPKRQRATPTKFSLSTVNNEEADDSDVFKKPAPVTVNKTKSKGKAPLKITIKKGKITSGKKALPAVSYDGEESLVKVVAEKSLFTIVRDGRSAIMSVINDWIESYSQDKTAAMAKLIQFFVQCSGCNASVTKPMIDAEDTVQAIRHLTENFGEEAEEYPLIINRPEYKKFKPNFTAFIIQLINLCQHNIIYDEEMMDILICWIIGLSDSQVRAFRHTSTFAGMKIVTGLIDVAIKVTTELDNTQRQLTTEEQKQQKQKSREKIERLNKRKEELQQNKAEVEDMVNRIFSSIFIHRYRDVRPEIRSICITEMGTWMNSYSSYFLDQNYLKYFGWTLYDKVSEVRLGVLRALEKLYMIEDFLEHLELFTCRFKDRLIKMTLDVDTEVSVQAIKIASLLYKYDALEEDDCSQVEQLVFCDQRRMAHAAGEFLALRIIRLSIEASPQKMIKGRKEDYLRQMNIKAILDFFIKTEIHDHCSYITDSLWEHTSLLKDWKTMTNLLLDTNALIELEDSEESALIDLMCCACKQAATAVGPPGRHINRKLSQKDKQRHMDDRLGISTHFMQHLPSLVEKYKADVHKVKHLLTIPQYFDLEIYAEKRLTKHLDDLLAHMEDVVMKHADVGLLDVCSQTYYYLMDNELVIQQTVEVSRNRLIDEIIQKFKSVIASGIPNTDDDKDAQVHHIFLTSLKRINSFYRNHNLVDWDIYDDIYAIIEQGLVGNIEDDVLVLANHITHTSLLMSLANLDPEKEIDKAELKLIRKRQKKFVKQMDELLQFGSVVVKTEVFKILCDFFVYFAKQLLNKAPQFAPIVCEADASLQVRMRDFIITHVFNTINEEEDLEDEEDDSKAQELYNKRTLLAGLCKLIGYKMFDVKLAAPIYAQFLRGFADYSDIIKQLMQKAKEGDIIAFSKVLLFALQQAFESLREDSEGKINPQSDEFNAIKDLARRFALMLGVNINQDNTRKSTITMHREGILYAFSYPSDSTSSPEKEEIPDVPPNLLFLEVLHEFTYRLIKVDRKVVIAHLQKTAGDLLEKKGHAWVPAKTYKNGIFSGSNDTKISDEAESILEAEMAAEAKNKKRSISFSQTKNAQRKRNARAERNKAKKKLSMSNADGEDYVSKVKKATPKVAKAIPRPAPTPTRRSSRGILRQTYEEAPIENDIPEDSDESSEDNAEEEANKGENEEDGEGAFKITITRTSQENYMVVSPSKAASDVPSTKNAKNTPRKGTPTKRSSGASRTPLSVDVGDNSSPTVRSLRKRKMDDSSADSTRESSVTSDSLGSPVGAESPSSQKSWVQSQVRVSAKKPRKSYSMRSHTPVKEQ